jgi:hypothetical protein
MWLGNRAWQQSIDGMLGDASFKGKWISFENGIRTSVNQPVHPVRTVHMLGNSALLAQFLPDEYTIPSLLQHRLNAKGLRWKVINYGTNGPTAATQLRILRSLKLHKGDIVIFYDGFVEVSAVYNALKRDLPSYCNDEQLVELIRQFCALLFRGNVQAADTDAQVQLIRYRKALTAAQQYTTAAGGSFYHFIQPHLFATELNAYERTELAPNPYLVWPDIEILVTAMWDDLVSQFNPTTDLTHALDKLRQSRANLFIDMSHCTEIANGVIADAMYNVLLPEFSAMVRGRLENSLTA